MEERAERPDATHPEAGEPAEPRPAETPEPGVAREDGIEPSAPSHSDEEGSAVEERAEPADAVHPEAVERGEPRPVETPELEADREDAVEPCPASHSDEEGSAVEERAEPADAVHPETGEAAELRPVEPPEVETAWEHPVEPSAPDHFDELALQAESGDPTLLLPEPRPMEEPATPDEHVAEAAAEPRPAQTESLRAEPTPHADAWMVPEISPPEPQPTALPDEPASVATEPEPSATPYEQPLHERIPVVLPSVELHSIRLPLPVPVFEAPPRMPEPPQQPNASSVVAVERTLAEAVAAAKAVAQEERDTAFSRPWLREPPRTSAPTVGDYLRRAARLAGFTAVALIGLVLTLIVLYRWVNPPASTLMLGQWLTGTKITQRWVPIDRISPYLHRAVITSEDGRFCQHRGVDWGEIEEAIERARDGIPRGGSTISMQVVKNLFLWPSKSYVRKAIEIPLTYAIELAWSKRRILEIYLNIAEWGPGVYGAEAAALYHFRKPAAVLTPGQAALLAVSLPNPLERKAGAPGPGTIQLAAGVHRRMQASTGNASCVRPPG